MNVLFLTYDFPYPTTSGGKNRAYHLIKHTSKKANIFLYSYVRDDYNTDWNEELLRLGVKEIKVFRRKKLKSMKTIGKAAFSNSSIFRTLYFDEEVKKELSKIIHEKEIDIIHCESSYTGYYIDSFVKTHVKQILGTENIEFKLYEDYASFMNPLSLKPFVRLQAKRLKNEEIDMVQEADAVTVITTDEVEIIKSLTGKNASIVANGIEPDSYPFQKTMMKKNNILFVGNFSYFPNVDAINFFYKDIFPKLPKELTITIIGKGCNEKFKFRDDRIIMKNFVEDIIDEYRAADILIFPIRIGGGTNFKVLEAMSLGVPIVAQPERLTGLKAQDNIHFLKAQTGEEYVEKIKMLYADHALAQRISQNARRLIEEKFDWEKIGADLLGVWRESL